MVRKKEILAFQLIPKLDVKKKKNNRLFEREVNELPIINFLMNHRPSHMAGVNQLHLISKQPEANVGM